MTRARARAAWEKDKSSRYGPHADMVTAGMMVRMSQGARGRAPTAISEGARLSQAVKIMADRNLGAILCTKEGDEGEGARLAGMVTERDYLRKVVLRGRTSEDTTCGDVMATRLDAARPSHTLDMCLRLFLTKYTRHIPVVSRHADVGRPSLRDVHGVVSMGDAGWILWTVLSKSREEAAGHRYWITDITVGHVLEVAQKEEKAFEIAPGKTVYEALEEMERHKIGGLLVRNPDERACGLITEHDYLTQVHVKGRSSKNTKVEDIMTAQPICVTPSDTIDDVRAALSLPPSLPPWLYR